MAYSTLMLHMDLDRPNNALFEIAGTLAAQFSAKMIGVLAGQPAPIIYGDNDISGLLTEQEHRDVVTEMTNAEQEFRAALQGGARHLEWRSRVVFGDPAAYVVSELRGADLLITGGDVGETRFDSPRRVNPSDLVMRAGRPVLIVPPMVTELRAKNVVIGWKDRREARCAVKDSLPLLKKAASVFVVELARRQDLSNARERVEDVVVWLRRHGIEAGHSAFHAAGDEGRSLEAIAAERDADLIVAGAYGHSRVREWALGGVTRSLLTGSSRCALLSH